MLGSFAKGNARESGWVSITQLSATFELTPKLLWKAMPHKNGKSHHLWSGYEGIPGDLWSRIKRGAEKRGMEFSITIEHAWDIFNNQNGRCALSGELIEFGGRASKKPYTASLDRIDSSKGYIQGNIQWLHKDVNMMKNNHTSEEFLDWISKIYKASFK